jgi:hypothetical protein
LFASSDSTTSTVDSAGVIPSEIVSGSNQSITFTAVISDPSVIASGVNVLEIAPNGSSLVLCTLTSTGGGLFTLTTTARALRLSAGTIDLRISAAFKGVLKRVQSADFYLRVDPVANNSTWISVSPENVFTIKLPPNWQVTGGSSNDGYNSYVFTVLDADSDKIATIFVFTPQQWITAQQSEVSPVFLAQNNKWTFAESASEAPGSNWYNNGLGQEWTQILATFQAN